ncbi:CPBP family intramembrane metalloprotease [Leucobacter allii]|uniref:CPBP family intramembrane glutamic endopeptidase n=1 Tax=Leucobacter allii TaxID=2932247 RepID=UPI001FD33E0A|nr:CPBP family intramembrane glutamic endopeptidase [Leucobacter allii]UOR01710.1 CPBP family intramembrane metalloprotease [Leucobacter allii]
MTSTGPEQTPGGTPDPQVPAAGSPAAAPAPQVPAEWAWARPQPTLRTVETEPLAYHRLLRGTANYRWWKPLLLLLLAGVYFGVFTVVVTVAMIPLLLAFDPEYLTDVAADPNAALDTQRPLSVLLSMLSIIVMIPSVVLAMLSMGMRPVGRVWSVAGRIRWGFFARLLGAALLGVIAMNVVGIGIGFAMDPGALTEPPPETGGDYRLSAAIFSLVLVILLVPFQATAEELVFRGLFMQVLGSWLRSPWFGILIPTVGFALAHIYDVWGLAAVGLMGGVAAWLSWRTGGLEAAMAIHIVNNLIAFGFMVFAFGGETAQTSDAGGPEGVVGEIVGLALFAWLALRIMRRGGHGRERIDLIQVPDPTVVAAAPATPGIPAAPGSSGAEEPRA